MASRLRKAGYGLTVAGLLAVGFGGGKKGVSTKAYWDIVGVPTICFGETRGVQMAETATMDECKAIAIAAEAKRLPVPMGILNGEAIGRARSVERQCHASCGIADEIL